MQVREAGEAAAAEAHEEIPAAGELQRVGDHRQVREWGAEGGGGEAAAAAQAQIHRCRHLLKRRRLVASFKCLLECNVIS